MRADVLFDLRFVEGPAPHPEQPSINLMVGRIVLGDCEENFHTTLAFWSAVAYERQWLEAGKRLIGGAKRVAFLTSVSHPDDSHHFWWPAWREEARVYVHSGLLLGEHHPRPLRWDRVDEYVGAREVGSIEEPISEWEVRIEDIADFVRRQA